MFGLLWLLFLIEETLNIFLRSKKLLHFFFRLAIARVARFLFCQQLGIFCCQPMLMAMSAWRANINLHAVRTTSHRSEATMVKLPCGSASTNRTFLPSIASPMPRLSQVVVLPVPPFWLTMAIVVAFFEIFITSASLSRGWFGSGRKAASWWVRCTEKRADIVSCCCCFSALKSGTR